MAEKRCYTVKDLQEMLDVSRSTVYKLLSLSDEMNLKKPLFMLIASKFV